jgi:apolipoprotein N-acyltransferase
MSLPNSDFTPGALRQAPLTLAGMKIAANICYEDAYPAMLNPESRAADLLVTVTNDAWFGHSGARYMHLQIARMRALESRRYLVRAANDGVSAVIGPFGGIETQAPEFTETVLRGQVVPRQGATPYLLLGNWLAIGVAALILAGAGIAGLRFRRRGTTPGN